MFKSFKIYSSIYLAVVILVFLCSFITITRQASCPSSKGSYLLRLRRTKYYIVHDAKDRKKYQVTYDEGKKLCIKYGLRMAQLDNLVDDHIVGRILEELLMQYEWTDTWYWIDSAFDSKKEVYVRNGSAIPYGNFMYRDPRPLGVGGHMSADGVYHLGTSGVTSPQCLSVALPLPYGHGQFIYGFEYRWDERPCKESKRRHVLCEHPTCDYYVSKNPMAHSTDKLSYYYDGDWIFANRRFMVNWKPRNKKQAEEYCKARGLVIYTPRAKDTCLIGYLKLWASGLTTYQFWTTFTYNVNKKAYFTESGDEVASNVADIALKSSKTAKSFCVTSAWSYQFFYRSGCNLKRQCNMTDWQWKFLSLNPANCEIFAGTICQHANINYDSNALACHWPKTFKEKATEEGTFKGFLFAANITAVVEFGFKGSAIYRSTYKQRFGSRRCTNAKDGKTNRRMIRERQAFEKKINPEKVVFKHDLMQEYWVVNENLFKYTDKPDDGKCSVISFNLVKGEYVRAVRRVACTEWHFYLCK